MAASSATPIAAAWPRCATRLPPRWRARNHPDTLSSEEVAHWQQHREARLLAGAGGARTLAQLHERLDTLADDAMERGDERAEAILSALADWAEHLGADLGWVRGPGTLREGSKGVFSG